MKKINKLIVKLPDKHIDKNAVYLLKPDSSYEMTKEVFDYNMQILVSKINEIIDYINLE